MTPYSDSVCPVVLVFISTIMKSPGVRNKVCLVSVLSFPVRRNAKLAKSIKNWLKFNEIESLKTEKSPRIILEKSWNFVFIFLYEPW